MDFSINLVRGLVDVLQRLGVAPDFYFKQAGFDSLRLENPAGRVCESEYDRLQQVALNLSNTPSLGIELARHSPQGTFGVLAYLILNCSTWREAIRMTGRFYRLVCDYEAPVLEIGETHSRLIYNFAKSNLEINRLRSEFGLTRLAVIAKEFQGNDAHDLSMGFCHIRPRYMEKYADWLPCNVEFNQDAYFLQFPNSLLDKKQPFADPEVATILKEQAEAMLSGLHGYSGRLGESVKALIRQKYIGRKPDLESVASYFHLSGRSLRRKLQEEGTTFGALADEVMAAVAQQALKDPELCIKEVAYRMGFSEPSSFHRAFKRWTGTTPQEWRRDHQAGTTPEKMVETKTADLEKA